MKMTQSEHSGRQRSGGVSDVCTLVVLNWLLVTHLLQRRLATTYVTK